MKWVNETDAPINIELGGKWYHFAVGLLVEVPERYDYAIPHMRTPLTPESVVIEREAKLAEAESARRASMSKAEIKREQKAKEEAEAIKAAADAAEAAKLEAEQAAADAEAKAKAEAEEYAKLEAEEAALKAAAVEQVGDAPTLEVSTAPATDVEASK